MRTFPVSDCSLMVAAGGHGSSGLARLVGECRRMEPVVRGPARNRSPATPLALIQAGTGHCAVEEPGGRLP